MENIYKKVVGALLEFVPEVKWIDMDEGQLDNYGKGDEPLTYPCALIKIDDNIEYENIAGGKQIARTNFYVRFAFQQFESAHAKVPTEFAGKAFEPYVVAKKAMQVINQELRNCSRVRFVREPGVDPRVFKASFKISYLDINI